MFRWLVVPALLICFFCAPSFASGGREHDPPKSPANQEPAYPSMPGPGKKVQISGDYYLVYGFDRTPKLGTVIMKIEVFTRDGRKDTSLEITGESGMPSMKGAHETGERSFQLSKKGAYLLPFDIVMPGDWEIRISVKKNGMIIFRGSHQFDV